MKKHVSDASLGRDNSGVFLNEGKNSMENSSGILRSPGGRWKKRTVKTVRFDQSPATMSTVLGATTVKSNDGDIDMATVVLNEFAIENYTRYWNLPKHHVSLATVQASSTKKNTATTRH